MHSLLHLAQVVNDLGPLWSTHVVVFEGMNGVLLKHIHYTNVLGTSVCKLFQCCKDFLHLEEMPTMLHEPGFLKKLACSMVEEVSKAQPLGKVDSVLSFEKQKFSVLQVKYMNAALQDCALVESPTIRYCGENHRNGIIVQLCFQNLIQMIAAMDKLLFLSNIMTHLPLTCQPWFEFFIVQLHFLMYKSMVYMLLNQLQNWYFWIHQRLLSKCMYIELEGINRHT